MYDFYIWTTPNGYKVLMFAEEAGLEYTIKPINISKGEQFAADFARISPNNKIPAMVDHEPVTGDGPIPIFESGAILLYLAEKTGRFTYSDLRGRTEVSQWLFWQMGGLGPMGGQAHHFNRYAKEKIPYAIDRYVKEMNRLYGVLNRRLADREFITGGDYTIADMASYPWIARHVWQNQRLEEFPNLKRWFDAIAARPATKRAYEKSDAINTVPTINEESRKILFGQTAATGQS